jgi:hypothetical protein
MFASPCFAGLLSKATKGHCSVVSSAKQGLVSCLRVAGDQSEGRSKAKQSRPGSHPSEVRKGANYNRGCKLSEGATDYEKNKQKISILK